MKKIKEIFRLQTYTDLSRRQIARALKISRPVISKYLTVFKASGLTYDEIRDLNDDAVYELLFNSGNRQIDNNERYALLSSKFDYFTEELKRQHVTLQKLWEEYIEENPNGYSRSQFFEHFNRYKKSCELTMHLEHKAGDKVFVDFTGKKLYITDKKSGNIRPVETFVAILPASHYTFVYATETQKTEDWIKGTEEAFWYFGGVTKVITPDCYKSAITKPNRYEPDINPEYSRFAEHYNTAILPARPAHPKDKALVENAVRIVYHWIYASLRNQVFYTLGELNKAILLQLEKYNAKKMQLTGLSRVKLFDKTEKNSLYNLPLLLYEHKRCSKATIQTNYHVLLSEDKKYYSVPYRYYSESIQNNKKKIKAELYYNRESVEIYFKGERIAVHKRNYSSNKYTTNPEHMPEKHRRYLERWNPEKIISLAKSKGAFVAEFIGRLISKHKHPEQSYNTCRGIIFLSNNYGTDRLNKACKKALHFGYCSYKAVKDILKNNREEMEEPDLFSELLPEHSNVRGKNYFKEKAKELISE